jgi:hypothetical protein
MHLNIYVYICRYVNICVSIYFNVYIYVDVYINMYLYMYTYIYTYTYIYRHDPTRPANGDLSAPWLSLDVFGSPSEVIWMFLPNLQPPKNIMECLVSSETQSSTCVSTSANRGAHCFGAKQTAMTPGAEISVEVPDFQARVPQICPTHGGLYKWG